MTLPAGVLVRKTVTVNGAPVEIRSLSRSEAVALHRYVGDEDGGEIFLIAKGTGCTEEEARVFRETTDVEEAGVLIDGIVVLSGLTKDSLLKRRSNGP